MAIPWDPTRHIEGMAAGVKDAMSGIQAGIQANQPGSENLQRFFNNFWAKREQGMSKDEAMDSTLAEFQQSLQNVGNSVQTPQLQEPGLVKGAPAIGAPGATQPTATGPNSFTPGQSLTQAAQTSAPLPAESPYDAAMQNFGMASDTPSHDLLSGKLASRVMSDVPYLAPATNATDIDKSTTLVSHEDESQPEPYIEPEPQPKISLSRKGGMGNMQTQTGGKLPPVPTRRQQEQEMADIQRIIDMETKTGNLENKQAKLAQDKDLKLMQLMSQNNRFSAKEKNDMAQFIAGKDRDTQALLLTQYLKMKHNQEIMALRWSAQRLREQMAPLQAKLPPELKLASDNYNRISARIVQLTASGMGNQNAGELERMMVEAYNARQQYNTLAANLTKASGIQYPIIMDMGVQGSSPVTEPEPEPEKPGIFGRLFGE